jgi:hypothetical protein
VPGPVVTVQSSNCARSVLSAWPVKVISYVCDRTELRLEVAAPLWRYPGADSWHFVSLPTEISTDIADITSGIRRGFGSVRVAVTVGSTSWRTSLFPDSKTGAYWLPVKKAVRVAERLEVGDQVQAQLQLADL